MDQRPYPGPSLLFHLRMSTLFIILWTTDFLMFVIAIENTMTNGVGGMVLFASEVITRTTFPSIYIVLNLFNLVWHPDGERSEHDF